MKEEKPWSSQVELSLDNRQIFLLFFASAVLLSLVFALGVVVGKRMDAAPARSATTDPLALLDQMGGDDSDEGLSYQQALAPTPAATAARAQAPSAAAAPAPAPAPSPAPIAPAAARAAAPVKAAQVAHATKADQRAPKPHEAARPEPVPPKARESAVARSASKEKAHKPEKSDAVAEGSGEDTAYTLQLSSFQEKREAEAFMQKLRQVGLKPYMTPTDIPGRGVWFRVRLGRYKSWDEALTAKQSFEKQQRIIAYVSKS